MNVTEIEKTVIGRSKKCTVILQDTFISNEHFKVLHEDGHFYLIDLKVSGIDNEICTFWS